jgi:CubicO group peptidase (beta-lactamase class C family)
MKIRATRCVVFASALLFLTGPLAAQGPPGTPQDTARVSPAAGDWVADNPSRIAQLRAHGMAAEGEHAVLWFLPDSVSPARIDSVLTLLDETIPALQRFIGGPYPWQRFAGERITFYFAPGRFISHARNGAVFISSWRVRDGAAPYLHEAMHVLLSAPLPDPSESAAVAHMRATWPQWLHEGFPDYVAQAVADSLGIVEFDVFASGGSRGVDGTCAARLQHPRAPEVLAHIGAPGRLLALSSPERQEVAPIFYACAHSFTRFLVRRTDPPFVASLFAEIATGGVEDRVRERTGQSLAALRADWLHALGAGGTTPPPPAAYGMAQDPLGRHRGGNAAHALPGAAPEALGMSAARLARIDSVAVAHVRDERIAGLVTLVMRGGCVVHAGTHGWLDVEARMPMREDALFRIASMTKPLTSLAVMMLVEEGRISLADPVSRYVPAFAGATVAVQEGDALRIVPAARPVTIEHLLTHTAGLPYPGSHLHPLLRRAYEEAGLTGSVLNHLDEPMDAVVDRLGRLPLVSHPGERFGYGYATDVLAVVVERVSGLPLDEFFRTRILEPLGMRDTHFFLPAGREDRLAAVHTPREGGGLARGTAPPSSWVGQGAFVDGPRRADSGGAGLLSSAADYARFLQMLLDGGAAGDVRLVGPEIVYDAIERPVPNGISSLEPEGCGPRAAEGVASFTGAR